MVRAAGTSDTMKRPDLNGSRVEGNEGEMGTRGETAAAARSYPASVRVGVFSHDALVVQDVLEGLAGETSAGRTHE